MNNPTPTTGENWRKLETPFRFKVSVLSPVSSFSSPYKGQRTGVEKTDPAWNALAEGQTSSSFPFPVEVRPDQHQPRHSAEHLATHDVLSLANTESYQHVDVFRTGFGRSAGNGGVTETVSDRMSGSGPLTRLRDDAKAKCSRDVCKSYGRWPIRPGVGGGGPRLCRSGDKSTSPLPTRPRTENVGVA
jgi:hypothetical protein